MSDPCGTLPLALKPNAVPRINCLLSNFYFCANWSVVPCQMKGLEGPVWGGGYMPRRRRLYANCQLPVELILYELRPNSPGGGYMPTTIRRRLYAKTKTKNAVSRSDPLQGSDNHHTTLMSQFSLLRQAWTGKFFNEKWKTNLLTTLFCNPGAINFSIQNENKKRSTTEIVPFTTI